MTYAPYSNAKWKIVFDTYLGGASASDTMQIVEIGAQDVNGSLRQVAPQGVRYIGVDFVVGKAWMSC